MPSERINLIKTPLSQSRFWDSPLVQELITEDGFKAIFVPTVGGSSTAWQNREILFALEVKTADGRSEVKNIGAGILEEVSTQRSSPLATLKIASMTKPLRDANAETVKDGAQWYTNKEMSFIINRLMEQAYIDVGGNLPDDKRVAAELLTVYTADGKMGAWSLGMPPCWDGETHVPSPYATPLTAMCTDQDRTKIYVGLGGMGGSHEPELWEYNEEENLWTKLAATTTDATYGTQYGGIHNLFYNTKDKLVYGVIWKDYGDVQSDIESDSLNWLCPPARIFWWNPGGDSGYLNDDNHSKVIDNFWPGTWDIREMYPVNSSAEIGVKKQGGTGPTVDGAALNTAYSYKLDYKASVGNFTAFKYVHVPFGPVGQQANPDIGNQEYRRTVHRYHPQPSRNNWENDPLMQAWGNTAQNTAKGELMPETNNHGNSHWLGASGGTPPNGWTKIGAGTTFSVTSGILDVDAAADEGMKINLQTLEDNMTIYRMRIEGGVNFKMYVGNSDAQNSVPYGPYGPTNSDPYTASHTNSGAVDFYFGVLSTNAINGMLSQENVHVRIVPDNPASNIQMNNLSLTVARHWDRWKDLDRQAGENLPITSFGKIAAAVSVRWPTHAADVGPDFELYDADVEGISSRQSIPGSSPSGQRNEDIFLEFNFVAQDRRLIAHSNGVPVLGSDAYHPFYGPSEKEDGISPDNSKRFIIGWNNIEPTPDTYNASSYANEARIVDAAPHMTKATAPEEWTGEQDYEADPGAFQTGRAGHGYASVHAQVIGERALDGTAVDDYSIAGAVRYTNGQQGFLVFSQEADDGDGLIVFAQFAGTQPSGDEKFGWGPSKSGRFELKYQVFRCGTHGAFIDLDTGTGVGAGVMPTRRTISVASPYLTGGDEWVPIYPTAGCVDNQGVVYVGVMEEHSQTSLYTGSNESDVHSRSYLIKLDLGTGVFTVKTDSTSSWLYQSQSDASVYNTDGEGGCHGNLHDDYASASDEAGPVNNTRKFCWLFFNPYLSTNKLSGWCFRRDSLLVDPAGAGSPALGIPCHELFILNGTLNKLIIVDHDIADSLEIDAVGFVGFVGTNGEFGLDKIDIGSNPGTWYFRLQKPAPASSPYEKLGTGIRLCYYYNDESNNVVAGQYWDNEDEADESKLVYYDEGFLGNKTAVSALVDVGLNSQREAIFSSFDHYLSYYQVSQEGRGNLLFGSSKIFFRIDDREVDPRLAVLDFGGLKAFDAISKLAQAYNFIFGFDVNKFFVVSRDLKEETTYDLNADEGDIIDLTKGMDNDIRNIVSIQPYSPIIQDVDWEITHVGNESVLEDVTLFNGDLILNIKTHKAITLNLICTRQGRLIRDALGEGGGSEVDAITDVESRLVPLFKWKVSAPIKSVVLMKAIESDTTELFFNTTFAAGNDPISKGEIVIFTNQETFEQIGRVITDVDSTSSKVNIEVGPGFDVERLTPLTVVSAHVGGNRDASDNSLVRNYSNMYSDGGVCVVQSINLGDPTELIVNNVTPFLDFVFKAYTAEGYKHYSFLVTTYGTDVIQDRALPSGDPSGSQSNPTAWIADVDVESQKITLNGSYTGFKVGDVLRLHYAIQPAMLIKKLEGDALEPPPYTGLVQDLPGGLASWHWVCDEETDLFNVGDIITFHFKGIKLVKDASALYTGVDIVSISKYRQRPWTFPDNRFMQYGWVEHWVAKILKEYGHPKYKITVQTPFKDSLTFLNPMGNLLRKLKVIDRVMFPNMSGFSVSGFLGGVKLDMKKFILDLSFRSEERY